jgi:hypothetical protein
MVYISVSAISSDSLIERSSLLIYRISRVPNVPSVPIFKTYRSISAIVKYYLNEQNLEVNYNRSKAWLIWDST